MSVFGDIARFYDTIYADKDSAAEARYVQGLLGRAKSPVRDILELGCGTGRHALELNKLGYRVTASEISEAMLSAARARFVAAGQSSTSLIPADLRTLDLGRQFDAVLACFHVINYQNSDADLRAAFSTAGRHLRPGGLFLFDSWHGPAVLAQRPEVRVKRMDLGGIEVVRTAEPVMDDVRRVVSVHYQYFARQRGTLLWERHCEVHHMRYLFLEEIENLADEAGMSLVHNEEWLSGNAPAPSTWGVAYLAMKRPVS